MSLLKRLGKAWNAFANPEEPKTPSASREIVKDKVPDEPPPLPVQTKEWMSDTQLRALVDDHAKDLCHWVIASDFEEFYRVMDRHNAANPPARQMRLEISNVAHDFIKGLMDKEWHLQAKNPFRNQTTHDTEESFTRTYGFLDIGENHIRAIFGGLPILTYYRGGLIENTSINFQSPSGEWVKYEFGMGHDIPFGDFEEQKIVVAPSVRELNHS